MSEGKRTTNITTHRQCASNLDVCQCSVPSESLKAPYHPFGGLFAGELVVVGLLSLIEPVVWGAVVGALAAFVVLVVSVEDVDPPGAPPA